MTSSPASGFHTRSIPEQRLVLRQLPGGELHGIFWTTSGRPPEPETLDPEFLDVVGVADPQGSTVAQVGVSIPGGLDFYELELDPWSFPWELTLTKPGLAPWVYRYESGGDNRAVVEASGGAGRRTRRGAASGCGSPSSFAGSARAPWRRTRCL